MKQTPLTPFKRSLLKSLAVAGTINGYNRSHAERALREMEGQGLVAKSYSTGRWSIRRAGREAVR